MKPTIIITNKHLTLAFGIIVGLIVVVLMMLRNSEANVAATHIFPTFEMPSPHAQISQVKFALIQALENIR
jgi:hypothetical protein